MKKTTQEIVIGNDTYTIDQILAVAQGNAKVVISDEPAFINKLEQSREMLLDSLKKGVPVYGVTTGYGKSCGKRLAMEIALLNGNNLLRFHGCGTGAPLGIEETRAAIMTRIICFSRGFSGVSRDLLMALAALLNENIIPVVPELGSVGASGDLTPMSYVGAVLKGDREVFYNGKRMPAADALKQAGLTPYEFGPKEPLAIMNGTSTMTGIAVMVYYHAEKIMKAAIASTALSIHALMGNAHHYHETISKAKPHPGQEFVAREILKLIHTESHSELEADALETLQDPYSLRCSPQIIGVLYDALKWVKEWVEIESNSANDNPIFDPGTGEVLMSGNFYGGHIAFAMDSLKSAIASVADMCDRQIVLLTDAHMNRGLPHDLVKVSDEKMLYNHGFKAMSITASALAAEALKATMPAATFSRSTESHNQDKVSMGTIAARDALRICYLTERVIAVHLLAATQACEIRESHSTRPDITSLVNLIRSIAKETVEDREMDMDIENITQLILNADLY